MADIKRVPSLDPITAAELASDDLHVIWDASAATFKRISKVELVRALAAWEVVIADFNAVGGGLYDVDTSAGAIAATIPADLVEGDRFAFNDFVGSWGTHALTIDPNGNEFEDIGDGSDPALPMTCDATAQFELVFADGKLRVR